MLQNLKVDIVYYKTGTDFEMEFNLGGCCRMRLLTAKAANKQNAIQCLARAVNRSKVIMVVGPLFEENGSINIVSAAIGSKTAFIDKNAYKIKSNEDIEIIEGSTPLISPEGYFGGCIIENGPQTMILLSDSKNIRKKILKSLIHPYLEELYAAEHKNFSITDAIEKNIPTLEETDVDEMEEIIIAENTDDIPDEISLVEAESDQTDESVEEIPQEETDSKGDIGNEEENSENDETEIITEDNDTEENYTEDDDIIISGGMIFDEQDEILVSNNEDTENEETEETPEENNPSEESTKEEEEIDLFVEPTKLNRRKSKILNDSYGDFEEENEIETEVDYDYRRNRKSLDLPILIIAVALLLLIAIMCYCIFLVPTKYGISSSEYINEIFTTLFG